MRLSCHVVVCYSNKEETRRAVGCRLRWLLLLFMAGTHFSVEKPITSFLLRRAMLCSSSILNRNALHAAMRLHGRLAISASASMTSLFCRRGTAGPTISKTFLSGACRETPPPAGHSCPARCNKPVGVHHKQSVDVQGCTHVWSHASTTRSGMVGGSGGHCIFPGLTLLVK